MKWPALFAGIVLLLTGMVYDQDAAARSATPILTGVFSVPVLHQQQPVVFTIQASVPDSAPRRYALTVIVPDSLASLGLVASEGTDCVFFHAAHWQYICYLDLDATHPATIALTLMLRPCMTDQQVSVRVYLVPVGTFDIMMQDFVAPIADRSFCVYLPLAYVFSPALSRANSASRVGSGVSGSTVSSSVSTV